MYRNCKSNSCDNNCGCGCNKKEEIKETICDNVMPMVESSFNECACGFDEEESVFPANFMYGHAYVPRQRLTQTFVPCEGLNSGTVFPELVSSYLPMQSIAEDYFLRSLSKEGCNNAY